MLAMIPLRLLIVMGIVSFTLGVIHTPQPPSHPQAVVMDVSLFTMFITRVVLLIPGIIAFLSLRSNTVVAFYIAIPIMAIAPIEHLILLGVPTVVMGTITSIGANVINMLVWLKLINTVKMKSLPVAWCFGLMAVSYFGGTLVGQLIAITFLGGNILVISVFQLIVLILALLVMLGEQQQLIVTTTTAADPPVDTRILVLARNAGLSNRESEVLRYWITGHKSAYIEQTLHISRNTVKTHLQHIYAKTNTSNREELLRLLEQDSR